MAIIDIKNCTLKIKDGSENTPNEIEVKIGEGNFQYTTKQAREYIKNKGALDTVRNADQEPMDVSFDFQWEYITTRSTSGADITIEDALNKVNGASDWVSSAADACEPYCVDLELTNAPGCGSDTEEVLTFPDFRYESLSHDLRGGSISCSGMCNALRPVIS